MYVGCPSKKYTRPIVPKLSICWEPNIYQMKDTFIMSKKVFHDETWISFSLASTQPEREVTLKTPGNLLCGLLLQAIKRIIHFFTAKNHCLVQKCYQKLFHANTKSFDKVLFQFNISSFINGSKLGPKKSNTFENIHLAHKCLDLWNFFTYHFEEH